MVFDPHTNQYKFQSLDWVDVDFDAVDDGLIEDDLAFQSLDWVDVDFDQGDKETTMAEPIVSIPRLG